MSRRIHVKVTPSGETSVEAEGFQGNGCEAATKAIEIALGSVRQRTRKADWWRPSRNVRNEQQLGEGGEP